MSAALRVRLCALRATHAVRSALSRRSLKDALLCVALAILALLASLVAKEAITQFRETNDVIQRPSGLGSLDVMSMALARTPRVPVSPGITLFSIREFSRVCCDFGATVFRGPTHRDEPVSPRFGMSERGLYSYAHALREFERSNLNRPVRIFVPIAMMREFYNDFFARLPAHARVVLVTGQEDCGPVEVFGLGRLKCDLHLPVALDAFLDDARLVKWFAQNLDIGPSACKTLEGHVRCADMSPLRPASLAKMEPLPIGIDFHTAAEKPKEPANRVSPAAQEQQLHALFDADWTAKEPLALAAFSAAEGKPDRALLLAALESAGEEASRCLDRQERRESVEKFWARQAGMQFVFCPRGNGLDVHRAYEALALGVVPVIRASPMDAMFRELPVVILDTWDAYESCDALDRWRADIIRRFGPRPFENARVQERLTLRFWAQRVNNSARL